MKKLLLLPLLLLASCAQPALPEKPALPEPAPKAIFLETKSFEITIGEETSVATLKKGAAPVTLCAQSPEYRVCNNTYRSEPREYPFGTKHGVAFFERELR